HCRNKSTAERGMYRWRGVGGERKMINLARVPDLQKIRNAAASGRVSLQHIDGFPFYKQPRIVQNVAIFTRGYIHDRWRLLDQHAQTYAVVRGHGFFEPGNAKIAELLTL